MKYTLRNKLGNVIQHTDNERQRDRLIGKGYTLIEEPEKKLDLDKMTVEQLETFAGEKGISLDGCSNKTEKLARIKETIGN